MRTAALGETGSKISRLGMGGWQASGSGPVGRRASEPTTAMPSPRSGAPSRAVSRGSTRRPRTASVTRRRSSPRRSGRGGSARRCWSSRSAGIRGIRPTGSARTSAPPRSGASARTACGGSASSASTSTSSTTPIRRRRSRRRGRRWPSSSTRGRCAGRGVSNFDVELLDRCEAIRHVDCLQPELSLLRRDALRDVIPWCGAHGTGVIAYSPMATGALSGAYDAGRLEELPADDWRRASSARILDLEERLRKVASRTGVNAGAIAVAWALSNDGVSGVICGARSPEQVDGWIASADVHLDPETLADRITRRRLGTGRLRSSWSGGACWSGSRWTNTNTCPAGARRKTYATSSLGSGQRVDVARGLRASSGRSSAHGSFVRSRAGPLPRSSAFRCRSRDHRPLRLSAPGSRRRRASHRAGAALAGTLSRSRRGRAEPGGDRRGDERRRVVALYVFEDVRTDRLLRRVADAGYGALAWSLAAARDLDETVQLAAAVGALATRAIGLGTVCDPRRAGALRRRC